MKHFVVFTLGLWLFMPAAHAGPLKDQYIATTIQELCSYHDEIIFVGHFYLQAKDAVHLEIAQSLHDRKFEMASFWNGTGGLSPELYDMLNSTVFMHEMAKCVPNDDERNFLVLKFIIADLAGQITAFSQVGAIVFGPGKILKYTIEKAYPIYLGFMARHLSAWKPLSARAFGRIVECTANLSSVVAVVWSNIASRPDKPDSPLELDHLKVLEGRIQKVQDLETQVEPSTQKFCVYQDFIYQTAQEYIEASKNLKHGPRVPAAYWTFKPCHATEEPDITSLYVF